MVLARGDMSPLAVAILPLGPPLAFKQPVFQMEKARDSFETLRTLGEGPRALPRS